MRSPGTLTVSALLAAALLAGCDTTAPPGLAPVGTPTPSGTGSGTDGPPPQADGSPDGETPTAGPSDVPGPTPTPDATVPTTASGFSPYFSPGDRFSVDLPSGWELTTSSESAIAVPPGAEDGQDGLIGVVNVGLEEPSVDELLALVDTLPSGGGTPVEVPGAVEARRFEGETFAPFEAIAAVDGDANGAAVIVFDTPALSAEQRQRILDSLQFPAVEPTEVEQ